MTEPAQRLVDTDVHIAYPSVERMAAYFGESVLDQLNQYYTVGAGVYNPYGGLRSDATPPDGGPPASDPAFVVEHHLDPYGIDFALLNPAMVGAGPDADLVSDLARATNDWVIECWLPADGRFVGGIVIAAQDPVRAAAEIRRVGRHPRMTHVFCMSVPCLLGNDFLTPIYEACSELALPFTLHPGGQEAGINTGSWAVGRPTTFLEYQSGMGVIALHHLQNLVLEGTFVKFPGLRVVMCEFGCAWLPFLMWRMDMEYRASRPDAPWLTMPPSEYIKQYVRFTTQPLEESSDPKDIVRLLDMVGGEDILLFASDYPHFDFDNPETTAQRLPPEWREKVLRENALEWYGLPVMAAREDVGVRASAADV